MRRRRRVMGSRMRDRTGAAVRDICRAVGCFLCPAHLHRECHTERKVSRYKFFTDSSHKIPVFKYNSGKT